jgi:hypothetical protein
VTVDRQPRITLSEAGERFNVPYTIGVGTAAVDHHAWASLRPGAVLPLAGRVWLERSAEPTSL